MSREGRAFPFFFDIPSGECMKRGATDTFDPVFFFSPLALQEKRLLSFFSSYLAIKVEE